MVMNARAVAGLASLLTLLDQRTGLPVPFTLNAEQLETLDAICSHQRVVVLKGRQIGLSTLCCLVDVAWAISHPGHTVVIAADVELKAKGLLRKCADWLRQLSSTTGTKLLVAESALTLVLANGARIVAVSGSARDAVRSQSVNLLHASELGFFQDEGTFGVMTSAMGTSSRIVIESSASPADNDFSRIWHEADNGYHHIFHGIESHEEYRAHPESIPDDRWAYLRDKFGFERRDSAAWWHAKLVSDFVSDEYRMGQEYPVHPAMAFAFATGTWIHKWRSETVTTNGWTKDRPMPEGNWTFYPGDGGDEPTILAADTASGSGGDYSFLARIGRESGAIHRTWHSNRHDVAEFAGVVVAECGRAPADRVVVEVNGVGYGVAAIVGRAGIPVKQHSSEADEKELRYAYLKRDIEAGTLGIGPELELECRQSTKRQDPNKLAVKYLGRDDGLSAVSIGMAWIRANAWERPVLPPDPTIVIVSASFDAKRKRIKL